MKSQMFLILKEIARLVSIPYIQNRLTATVAAEPECLQEEKVEADFVSNSPKSF